ncbi:Scytalone dehydratase [Boeremia exigua]|uniref:Scytalone dehydratase n=1 Tax=Boeremia exigua TaxID=749465 RepID=UPI001E8DAAA1|nr:Scytalone dehydratase [Boeremia exigua]KAH6629154.1 Scytalone dehydratase [Boeremia exigua]
MASLAHGVSSLFFGVATPRLTDVSFTDQDYNACSQISFEWACSYDTKNWTQLESILLPNLNVDYRAVMGPEAAWPNMTAAEFVAMMSAPGQLGNPLIATQHLLGGSSWQRVNNTTIIGSYQMRAAHVRYAADNEGLRSSSVVVSANSHAIVKHTYGLDLDGAWKLAGIQPSVLFDEGNLSAIFDADL